MKKFLLLAFLILFGFVLLNRQRTYVRDPLASVYRNGDKQKGVQVYINYSNDVLLIHDADPGAYRILVQNWNKMPGTPVVLKCIHSMACMANADHASTIPVVPNTTRSYDPKTTMDNREVSYTAPDGAKILIQLR